MRPFLLSWGILLLLAFIWGSSFILMKRGMFLEELPMFSSWQVASLRLGSASLVLWPFVSRYWRSIKATDLSPLLIVGWFGNGIPAYLFTLAETRLNSSMVGMLNSLTPLFTFLVAIFIFRTGWKWLQLVGIGLGMAGAVYLISLSGMGEPGKLSYGLFVIFATLCYAISVNTIRNRLCHLGSVQIASFALLLSGLPSLIYFLLSDPFVVLEKDGGSGALLATLVLGVIGTAGALVLFNGLIKREGALFGASVTYIIPVFAVMWGVLDEEHVHFGHGFAGLLILSGVYLVNKAGPLNKSS